MREPSDVDSRLAELQRRRPQALAQLIEESITTTGLQPGTRLGTKRELQVQYGVGTTTVNEAIRVLENRGLVQAKPGPGGGLFVAKRSGWLALSGLVLDFKNALLPVSQVLEVRDAIEGLVAADAALHHRKKDIADLRRLLKAMAAQLDDPPAYLRANWHFHRRAAQLCANEFARGLYEGLLDFAEAELGNVQPSDAFNGPANLATHQEYLDAISSREPGRVADAVERHNAESRATRRILT